MGLGIESCERRNKGSRKRGVGGQGRREAVGGGTRRNGGGWEPRDEYILTAPVYANVNVWCALTGITYRQAELPLPA